MKAKFCWLALVANIGLAVPAQADGRYGNGNVAVGSRAPARSSAVVRSAPRGNFGGGRAMIQGQRFSSIGMRPRQPAFRQYYANPNSGASIGQRFAPRGFNRTDGFTRFVNPRTRLGNFENRRADRFGQVNRGFVNANEAAPVGQQFAPTGSNGVDRVMRFANSSTGPTSFENRRADRGQISNGNRVRGSNSAHVFARFSAGSHPDWDRRGDHWWHGHCCRFVNGVWVVFDLGFYPWGAYGYPDYSYYPYDYSPSYDYSSPDEYSPSDSYSPSGSYSYEYGPGTYDNGDSEYYDRGAYNSPDQYGDRTVAAAQTELAREGYYGGEIDGVLGPETRRALVTFQSDHGLSVTGNLSAETVSTLGLQ